jgi:chorismate mutase
VTGQGDDPLVQELREQITDADRRIVATLNERLGLVRRLWQVKEERGYSFVDPGRERRLLEELERANDGPLTAEGLGELVTEILALTKRELGRAG